MSTAIKRIESILTSEFEMNSYVELAREIFSSMRLVAPDKMKPEFSNFSSHVASYAHVGNYETPESEKIAIFAVELKQQTYVENSRSTQRSYAKKLIENGGCDAALIAFYTPNDKDKKWRLSFVVLDYEMKIENGKMKTEEKLTPARRYSYLVGKNEPCHTAISRFGKFIRDNASSPTLQEMEEAFSVEAVTNEFFDLYCEKFYQLVDYLDSNEAFKGESERCGFSTEQFAKKLMGQIVFLYFLQKKGWLGVGVWNNKISEKEYKDIFYTNRFSAAQKEQIQRYLPVVYVPFEDGYRFKGLSALESIPDEVEENIANAMPGDRNWGSGSKTFLRTWFDWSVKHNGKFYDNYLEPLFYATLNKNRGDLGYSTVLHCRVPFLSGGLFDPIDGYDWEHTNFDIPDYIFSNKKSDDDLKADGILDIFDRYNFTMSEDEPLEREVAIDPEMLGKVFENLLDIKDRKSKGAFYTPREIVHYMCQESLVNYITTNIDISEDAIKNFILYGDFYKDTDTEKTLKVNDSNGSYHMEFDINRELKISPEIFDPKAGVDRIREIDELLKNIRVADPAVGSGAFPLGMLNEIVRARQNCSAYMATKMSTYNARLMYINERSAHTLKYETIKNCIFAADIEPSAVDIAQLRLWLALVIDDEINPDAQTILDGHKNPLPLPNLECNIVCGNSLIDSFKGNKLIPVSHLLNTAGVGEEYFWSQEQIEKTVDKLLDAQNRLFACDDPVRKEELKKETELLKDSLIQQRIEQFDTQGKQSYDESKKLASKPYVLWQIEFAKVFKEKGGFDVVIGNPPYGLLNKKQNQNTSIKATPEEIEFYKKERIYAPAKGGMINIFRLFICKSFDLMKKNGHMSLIFPMAFMCDLSASELRRYIFNAGTIQYLEAFPERDNENKRVFKSAKMSVCILGCNKEQSEKDRPFPMRINDDRYVNTAYEKVYMSPENIETIDENGLTIPLVDKQELAILVKMCNNADRLKSYSKCYTGEIDLSLDKKYVRTDEEYHRMLRGAQVQRYYITDEISQGEIYYLDSETYLNEVKSPRSAHHNKRRIGMQGITGVNEKYRLKMTVIEPGIFCANSVNYLIPNEKIEYILALCNSHLLNWFFKKLSTNSNVNGYEVDNLPIIFDQTKESTLKKLVDSALEEGNTETKCGEMACEADINMIVYEIYKLSAEEIAKVESTYN